MRYIILFFITFKLFGGVYTPVKYPFIDGDYKEIIRLDEIKIVDGILDTNAKESLDIIVNKINDCLDKNDDFLVSIIGHTAELDENIAHEKSLEYARKVQSILVERNISKELLVIQSKSNKHPLYTVKVGKPSERVMLALYVFEDLDSDRDGVRDKDDRCKESKLYEKVNLFGCVHDITVVLVSNNKDHNAIKVSTAKASQLVDKVNYALNLYSQGQAPSKPKKITQDTINSMFPYISSLKNLEVKKYTLYFLEGSSLTKNSQKEFSQIIQELKNTPNAILTLEGYTDTKGSVPYNLELSKKRVDNLVKLLNQEELDYLFLEKKYFGEKNLEVETADDIEEALNRRIELLIR